MKSKKLICISAIALLVALAIPGSLAAQQHPTKHHQYKLVDLGTFGGPSSNVTGGGGEEQVLNSSGTVACSAETPYQDPNNPGHFIIHSCRWRNGHLTDLGSLPGGNNSDANWINARGLIIGWSENGVIDPLTGHPETDAVLYRDGQIINLGTFGGNQSFGLAINDRRKVQLVGWALNTIPDPISPWGYFGTQMRAFLWTTDRGLQDLGTLGGPDSLAELVNNHGQIAGQAFTNSIINHKTGMPTLDPFFWEDNKMVDMGTLGGTVGNSLGFNNKGQIVGESNLKGDVVFHPFFWEKGLKNLKDLGTLGGSYGAALWINDAGDAVGWANTTNSAIDHAVLWKNGKKRKGTDLGIVNGYGYSFAYSINSMRQIVGCGANNNYTCSAAFLWEDGQMVDLNTLVAGGSGLHLFEAVDINDRGEIAGNGALQNGDVHAFLLTPCDDHHDDGGDCEDNAEGATATAQSSSALVTRNPTRMTEGTSSTNDRIGGARGRLGRRYPYRGFETHQEEK